MAVNFGLLQNLQNQIKTPIDYEGQASDNQLKQLQAQSLQNQVGVQPEMLRQAVQSGQLKQAQDQLDFLSNAAGYATSLPDDNSVNAWYQGFKKQYGNVIPNLPDTMTKVDASAAYNAAITAKDRMANQAQMYKAQGELAIANANLGLKAQDNNIQALKGQSEALTQGSPLATNFSAYTGSQGSQTPGMPGAGTMPQAGGTASATSPMQMANGTGQSPISGTSILQVSPQNFPQTLNGSQLSFPAEIQAQKKQAEDWTKFKDGVSSGAQKYYDTKNILNDLDYNVNNRTAGNFAGVPGVGTILEHSPSGQNINKDAARLKLNLVESLSAAGISRIDIPIVKTILESTPEPGKYNSVNNNIISKLNVGNELVNNILPKITNDLSSLGVRDKGKVISIFNQVIDQTGIYDNKDGTVDLSKLNGWENHFKDAVAGIQSKPAQQQNQSNITNLNNNLNNNQNNAQPMIGVNPNTGKQINYKDFSSALKQANPGAADEQINQLWQQKYLNQSSSTSNKPSMLDQMSNGIASVESSGAKNPYTLLGSAQGNGDRAIGKYQVMASNVAPWTKEALGQSMTPQQFINSPDAQEAVFKSKMGQYLQQYGNPKDAASVWFSGRPMTGNNSKDSYGTSVPQYVSKVMNSIDPINTAQAAEIPSANGMADKPTATPLNQIAKLPLRADPGLSNNPQFNNYIGSALNNYTAANQGVKYGFGSKSTSAGNIDCSGWVAENTLKTMQNINQQMPGTYNTDAMQKLLNQGAAWQIVSIGQKSGFIPKEQVLQGQVAPGTLIGISRENVPSWAKGRPLSISHIGQVTQQNGQLMVSQSAGSTDGVSLVPYDQFIKSQGIKSLYAVNPFTLANSNNRLATQ